MAKKSRIIRAKKKLLFVIIAAALLILVLLFFKNNTSPPLQMALNQSSQLVLVTTMDWHDVTGVLQRYERDERKNWVKVGGPMAVVIGRNGVALGDERFRDQEERSRKKEGDGKTPLGIFKIGPMFGFSSKQDAAYQLNYFPLTRESICVDDSQSHYYNQLLNRNQVKKLDWNSGELMRTIATYRLGAVIQYNKDPIQPNAGSCIFLHIWKNAHTGTAGCIAMEESHLKTLLIWLSPSKNPLLLVSTKAMAVPFELRL